MARERLAAAPVRVEMPSPLKITLTAALMLTKRSEIVLVVNLQKFMEFAAQAGAHVLSAACTWVVIRSSAVSCTCRADSAIAAKSIPANKVRRSESRRPDYRTLHVRLH